MINRQHRSALAKFRCGVAPLKIETGRYERIPHDQRFCFSCANKVEDEIHVLTECPLYDDLRHVLYQKAADSSGTFIHLSDNEKMCFVLSNREISKTSAKTCYEILNRRRTLLYAVRTDVS